MQLSAPCCRPGIIFNPNSQERGDLQPNPNGHTFCQCMLCMHVHACVVKFSMAAQSPGGKARIFWLAPMVVERPTEAGKSMKGQREGGEWVEQGGERIQLLKFFRLHALPDLCLRCWSVFLAVFKFYQLDDVFFWIRVSPHPDIALPRFTGISTTDMNSWEQSHFNSPSFALQIPLHISTQNCIRKADNSGTGRALLFCAETGRPIGLCYIQHKVGAGWVQLGVMFFLTLTLCYMPVTPTWICTRDFANANLSDQV